MRIRDSLAVNALAITMLQDKDSDVRANAAGALGEIGGQASPAVPALVRALEHDKPVRAAVVVSLGQIGADSIGNARRQILVALSSALADQDSIVRMFAAHALRKIGVPAATQLIRALHARDRTVRITAIQALAEQPPSPQGIDALVSLFADPDSEIRADAVSALGGFGPSVAPQMRTMAASSNPVVRRGAAEVLAYQKRVDRLAVADRCFELALGPWSPRLDISVDTIYSTPPMTVRFTRIRNDWFAEEDEPSFRVLPANDAPMSVHGPGFWTPVAGRDSLAIVWSTGFSGLTMKLAVAAEALHGEAETFWDFPRPRQTSQVTGVRVPCK